MEPDKIFGLFKYPKAKDAKGRISPLYNRLNLQHEVVILVTGTRNALDQFKVTVDANDGTIYLGKVIKVEQTGKTFLVFDITEKVKENDAKE